MRHSISILLLLLLLLRKCGHYQSLLNSLHLVYLLTTKRTGPIYLSTTVRLRNLRVRDTAWTAIAIQHTKMIHWHPVLVSANSLVIRSWSSRTSAGTSAGKSALGFKWVSRKAPQTNVKNTSTYATEGSFIMRELLHDMFTYDQNDSENDFHLPLVYSQYHQTRSGTQKVHYFRLQRHLQSPARALASSSASKRAHQIPTHGSDSYQRLLGWTSVSNKCSCMGSFNSYISFTLHNENAVRIHLIVIQCYFITWQYVCSKHLVGIRCCLFVSL